MSCSAGAAPRYGTPTSSIPASFASSEVARWPVEPVPGCAILSWRLLHHGEQFGERVRRERLASDQHQRVLVDEGDRRQVLLGVETELRIERDIRRNLQVVQQQRVAVLGAARDPAGRDRGAAAADVLDDEILSELLGELRRQHARELVGRPARRIGNDDRDGAARIVLRGGVKPSATKRPASERRSDAFMELLPCELYVAFPLMSAE